VPEYRIVEVDARVIERWRPGDDLPEIVDSLLEWSPPGFDRPLALDVAALFPRVWRE
jgi:hypothetical protein